MQARNEFYRAVEFPFHTELQLKSLKKILIGVHMRNSFFFVRTCASSSLNAEIVICLSISLLYHTRRYLALLSVRYCLKTDASGEEDYRSTHT